MTKEEAEKTAGTYYPKVKGKLLTKDLADYKIVDVITRIVNTGVYDLVLIDKDVRGQKLSKPFNDWEKDNEDQVW